MIRMLSTTNIFDKKHKVFTFADQLWSRVFGTPETSGLWIIYGPEKNGKTWMALIASLMLSTFERVLYVSGEEGIGFDFVENCNRAGLERKSKRIYFLDYTEVPELYVLLARKNAPRIVLLDNMTVYNDELKNGALRKLIASFPSTLFIVLAHEERGEPFTATAKLAKKLAKIIIHVKGLACTVSGRCPGGIVIIDEEKACLYHGEAIKSTNELIKQANDKI